MCVKFWGISLVFILSMQLHAQPLKQDVDYEAQASQNIEKLLSGDAALESSETTLMPTQYDWVRLTSGEWLKGELVAMYREELEFDSDVLDTLILDWEDIAEIRTHTLKRIRFQDGSVVEGQLLIQGDAVQLLLANRVYEYPRAKLISIAAGDAHGFRLWDGKIALGGNLRRGNTVQDEYTVDVKAKRRTPTSRLELIYLANQSLSQSVETENNHRANINFDWFLSNRWFLRPIAFEAFRDRFQNIELRATYSFRPGYYVIDNSKTTWSLNAGLGYQSTRFVEVDEGEEQTRRHVIYAMGTAYDTEITKDIDFEFIYDLQVVGENAGGYLHHLKTSLDIDLISDFDLSITLIRDHVSDPVSSGDEIPQSDDTRLIFGISYEF